MKVPLELLTSFIYIFGIRRYERLNNDKRKSTNLAVFLPHLRVLPAKYFRVEEAIPFAWCSLRACLSPDLGVLVAEGYMFRSPSVVERI